MIRTLAGSGAAFVITLALVPLVRSFCNRAQILDRPGALKIHAQPIPRLGGVAIFVGVLPGLIASGEHILVAQSPLLAAMLLIWLVGLLDDLWGLHPGLRLLAQLATGVLLWREGWHFWFAPGEIASLLVVCSVVLLFTNAFNFLDGSDGLAAGVACAIAFSFALLPASTTGPHGPTLAFVVAATCVAFLFENFPPARIFAGDGGSTLLGFLIAVLSLQSANATSGGRQMVLFPFAVAALPIFDALRIVVRRIAHGVSPLFGDRLHIYDQLLAKCWTPRTVALTAWSITALCGAFSIVIIRAGASGLWLLLPFAAVAAWILTVASPQKQSIACTEPHECTNDCNADQQREVLNGMSGGTFQP